MRTICKSLKIADSSDYSIIKHHITNVLELSFECEFADHQVINFYDEYLYETIKSFIKHTKIKFSINKNKDV
jgi:hypothetical protein